ncbi:hypothetical protein [Paraburkholderia sp. SIMBA_054]|uniref:hypothetical protein n=1 Tax=Paraburkholderia sp. SIMBA_054 TaxID=3085795 RepID=UPI00397E043E
MNQQGNKQNKLAIAELVARFVDVTFIEEPMWYVVGAGDKRAGQRGKAIANIGLKHGGGYLIILQLENGKTDSFAPMQLFPDISHTENQTTVAARRSRRPCAAL